jgi:hypothetical protein
LMLPLFNLLLVLNITWVDSLNPFKIILVKVVGIRLRFVDLSEKTLIRVHENEYAN